MEKQDDRTALERHTHSIIVVGTDSFLSGWGAAEGGRSLAGWACRPEDVDKVEAWVRARSDMRRVKIRYNNYKPKGPGHYHIYCVRPGHSALL